MNIGLKMTFDYREHLSSFIKFLEKKIESSKDDWNEDFRVGMIEWLENFVEFRGVDEYSDLNILFTVCFNDFVTEIDKDNEELINEMLFSLKLYFTICTERERASALESQVLLLEQENESLRKELDK